MRTENIVKFLQANYSDEKLAALLAHCEDGKLSFVSCCCFIGVATANHPLRGKIDMSVEKDIQHYLIAKCLPYASLAEVEYLALALCNEDESITNDDHRRKFLTTIIKAEIERRDKLKVQSEKEPDWAGVHIRAHFAEISDK